MLWWDSRFPFPDLRSDCDERVQRLAVVAGIGGLVGDSEFLVVVREATLEPASGREQRIEHDAAVLWFHDERRSSTRPHGGVTGAGRTEGCDLVGLEELFVSVLLDETDCVDPDGSAAAVLERQLQPIVGAADIGYGRQPPCR